MRVRNIERLRLFEKNGDWTHLPMKARFPVSEYYDELIVICSEWEFRSEATRMNTMRGIRKYFFWLRDNGYATLDMVDVNALKGFIEYCMETLSNSSTSNIKGYLKRAYQFFYENGYAKDSFQGILSLPIAKRKQISAPIPPLEIATTLKQIDRSTVKGKRDYAIIMLGVITGLRAVDVAKLKLQDIDWQRGEINVSQSKTGKVIALPLTTDVGEALKDYILNGRPQSADTSIFLRIQPPHKALFASSVDMEHALYRQGAGLKRMGFHSLRRALGKSLVTAGVAAEDVAQVFGSKDVRSITPHISLDAVHLKECALDLAGIKPQGGDWK